MSHKRKRVYVVLEDMTDVKRDWTGELPLPNTICLGVYEDKEEAQKFVDKVFHNKYCTVVVANYIYDVL